MGKNNRIDFRKFDTKEVRTESYTGFAKSIFRDVFETAFSCIEEIIKNLESSNLDDKGEVNNIIVFTGERGTGKTTAMQSFVNYLDKDISRDLEWKKESIAKEYRFECVSLIDPSKLTAEENIITLVVAYIYEEIKKLARKESVDRRGDAGTYIEKLKAGVRKCQEIYNVVCVKYTSFRKNIEQNPDTVETFSEIAKATRIRELIQELVDIYLDILGDKKGSKNSVLIIPIDDLDTNIKNAYTLAEDLRSYFMVSKVIIMMAVKMEQLNDVMQLKFCEDFKNLSLEGQRMDSDAETMATKYLEKLVTHNRRIVMPSFSFQNLKNYTVITRVVEEDQPLVEYVLRLLYQKTGIVLVKNELDVHEFIPCNLRTMHQMLQMLEALESVSLQVIKDLPIDKKEGLSKEQQILSLNLEKVYNFLVNNSTSGNMPKELVEILRRIGQQPVDMMNAFLVRNLCKAFKDSDIGDCIKNNPVITNFASLKVHPRLITLGDILYLLNEVERAGSQAAIRQFVMSVKVIYSITMIRLLFVQEDGPDYSAAAQLLGSTICNPSIQLLPAHRGSISYEWMPRVKGTGIKVRMGNEGLPLDGKSNYEAASEEDQQWNDISVTTAVKMSFYVLGYHRMQRTEKFRQIDPHVYEQGDYPLLKYRRSTAEDINSALIAFHWMSFVSLSLIPEKTVDAMLHYLKDFGITEDEEYKNIMDKIKQWRTESICVIPIYSIDILNELVNDMHERRFDYDDGTAKEKELHGYSYFLDSLRASLQFVMNRTYMGNGDKENVTNNFEKCPILLLTKEEEDQIERLKRELEWLNE